MKIREIMSHDPIWCATVGWVGSQRNGEDSLFISLESD
jgi:hypothetical protein